MSLMGIHIGYGYCRGIVIDGPRVLALAQAELGPPEGTPAAPGLASLWPAVRQVIQTLAESTRAAPVVAIGLTSLGPALVGVTAEGSFLRCCAVTEDAAASTCPSVFTETLSLEEYYGITGQVAAALELPAHLCAQREEAPNDHYQTWRYLPLASSIANRLGGDAVCDPSLAASLALYDIHEGTWSRRMLAAFQLARAKLPDVVPSGTAVGRLSAEMAAELRLPTGVRLVLAGLDHACRALGSGAMRSGLAALDLGSSVDLVPAFNAIALTQLLRQAGLSMTPHVVPDLWHTRLYSGRGGSMLRWFRDQLAPLEARQAQRRGENPYDRLLAEMPEGLDSPLTVPPAPGAAGPHAPTAGAIVGLTYQTTRGALLKGMVEGIAFEAARLLAQTETLGLGITQLAASGGGARSLRWLQIMADVLGTPVARLAVGRPEPLGAAILAGVGAGVYASAVEGAEHVVRFTELLEPDKSRARAYGDKARRYWALQEALGALAAP
jgi:xylulokinase